MAAIILVHGIDQEGQSAMILESQWLPSLARGTREAGFPEIADRIWKSPGGAGDIKVRMAFYANLFLRPGMMGTDSTDEPSFDQAELANELALEWLWRCATRVSNQLTRRIAETELANLQTDLAHDEMGVRSAIRLAGTSLARLPWFANLGMSFAERFVNRALAQVTSYLTNDAVRAAAQRSVLDLISPETRIILGHSLGSVVAYEVAHQLEQPLPLLVTLGSPLGLDTIVYPRLRPQPPSFPPLVRRWVNVADHDDLVAADPNLNVLFAGKMPRAAIFEGSYTVENGADPHNAEFYLQNVHVGRSVGQVMSATR